MSTRRMTRETRVEQRRDDLDPPGHWNVAMTDADYFLRHGYQVRTVERYVTEWVEVVEPKPAERWSMPTEHPQVVDLMAALEKSVAEAKAARQALKDGDQ